MNSRGSVPPGAIATAVGRSEVVRKRIFDEFSKTVQAARRLGVSEDDVMKTLRANGVAVHDVGNVMSGTYIPRQYTPEQFRHMMDANPAESQARYKELLDVVTENNKKYGF
jgi:hypothetical protein